MPSKGYGDADVLRVCVSVDENLEPKGTPKFGFGAYRKLDTIQSFGKKRAGKIVMAAGKLIDDDAESVACQMTANYSKAGKFKDMEIGPVRKSKKRPVSNLL